MQPAQSLADLRQVHFDRFEFLASLIAQQHPDFLVQLFGQLIQPQLALFAFAFQAGPFAGLGQAVAVAVEQFGRAAEVAAAGEDFQRAVSLVQAGVAAAAAEVAVLQLVLGQEQLAAQGGLFDQQQGGGGTQVGAVDPWLAFGSVELEPLLDTVLGRPRRSLSTANMAW